MKIAVAGCTGRMGITLLRLAGAMESVTLAAGGIEPGTPKPAIRAALAQAGAPDLPVSTNDPRILFARADAVIDFTSPGHTVELTKLAAGAGKIHIIGTTGLSPAQDRDIIKAAKKARIVRSANFSLGVNLMESLVERAAALLDEDYDIEIMEMHHRMKKDAPSGTALMLGRAAAHGRAVKFEDKRVSTRDGITGERRRGDIGLLALRGGDVVGEHDVIFAGPGELLKISHTSFSREIYAHGALRAALWAVRQKPGLYAMKDVLGL